MVNAVGISLPASLLRFQQLAETSRNHGWQRRLMSDAAQEPYPQIGHRILDQDERLALAAAAAIRRLVAERIHSVAMRSLRRESYTSPESLHSDPRLLPKNSPPNCYTIAARDRAVSTVVQEPAEPAELPTHPKEKQDAPRE